MLVGHGTEYGVVGEHFEFPNYNPIPYSGWFDDQQAHDPMPGGDYGYNPRPGGVNAWGYERTGKFWQNNQRAQNRRELRWLTIFGCAALQRYIPGFPQETAGSSYWRDIISPGFQDPEDNPFLSSVCGFRKDVFAQTLGSLIKTACFHRNPEFSNLYSDKMLELFSEEINFWNNQNPYEPAGPRRTLDSIGQDLWACIPSSDISVTAWMEAACYTLKYASRSFQRGYMYRGLDYASGIDHDNFDGEYYYYYLDTCPLPGSSWYQRKFTFQINRTTDFTTPIEQLDDES